MRLPVVRWLVFFFTRPIRLSDFASILRRREPKEEDDDESTPVSRERMARPRQVEPGTASARVSGLPEHPASIEIEVSEQPLDTLPAELQEELLLPERARAKTVASTTPADGGPAKAGD
jgi:hypothetical protein